MEDNFKSEAVKGEKMKQQRMKASEYLATLNGTKGKKRGEMNKTEAAFAEVLEYEKRAKVWDGYKYESIKLRLADGAWYTPDFDCWIGTGLTFFEVKGFWREAARVRIKVAAELYPQHKFIAVQKLKKKDGGGWKYEEF